MPNYVDASITTIDGPFTVLDDPIDVVDGSEWPAGNFTIKVWDASDAKVLKAVIYVGTRTTNALSGLIWNYGGHTDVNLADGDYVALEIAAPNYPPPIWSAAVRGAYDDYFDVDNEADWTAVAVSGSITWNYRFASRLGVNRGVTAVYEDQTANDYPAYLKSLSGVTTGDYIQTSISNFKPLDALFINSALCFTDGVLTTSNVCFWGPGVLNTELAIVQAGHGTLTATSTFPINDTLNTAMWGAPIHWRLLYSAANTFQAFFSLNGEDWTQYGSDIAKAMTPTHGGFLVSSTGSSPIRQSRFSYFHSNVTP